MVDSYRIADIMTNGFPMCNIGTLRCVRESDRTDFGARLLAARKHAGLSQTQLAHAVGMRQSSVAEAERFGQGSAYTAQIALRCGVSVEWLATGEGSMLPVLAPRGPGDQIELPEGAIPVSGAKWRGVVVVGKMAGGLPERIWTDGDQPVGATDRVGLVMSTDPQAFLCEVSEDSMVPKYMPGDFALVEPGTEPELEDDVMVRLASGETMLKRLLSRRSGFRFGSYNSPAVLSYDAAEVSWVYYVAYPVPRRKIKQRW